MNEKIVTICIPLYNCENTISNTLDSLLKQTYKHIKIKVFDNQSTDNSSNIVKKYAEGHVNIYYELNEENLGAEGNFTKCIQNAEGDFTGIFHADDVYYSTIIEEQVNYFEKFDVVFVASHSYEINRDSKIIGTRLIPKELDVENVVVKKNHLRNLIFKYANFITCPSVLVRTEVYRESIKAWNIKDFGTSADLDVWLRLNKIGSMGFINKPLMEYRLAEESYSYRISKVRTTRHDLFKVLDKERNLNEKELQYKKFLEFKDITLRIINILRKKDMNSLIPEYHGNILSCLKLGVASKWHAKIFIVGLFIFILRPFLKKSVRKFVGVILG